MKKIASTTLIVLLVASIYTLTVSHVSGGDGNDSFDEAKLMTTGTSISESLDSTSDIEDYYKVHAMEGQIINASVFIHDYNSQRPSETNFDIYLYNPYRVMTSYSESIYRYDAFSALAISTGFYYIKVKAVSGEGMYTLNVKVSTPPTLSDGQTVSGYLTNRTYKPADWYRIYLEGGKKSQHVKITMNEDSNAFFDLYLMDLWNEYSFWYDISWWGDPVECVEATASYTGFYYLQVHAYRGEGNYTLNVEISEEETDNDNTAETATLIQYNQTRYGYVSQSTDHYDWYKATLYSGEKIDITVRITSVVDDIFTLSILYPNMTVVSSRTNYVASTPPRLSDTISLSEEIDEGGTYYILFFAKVAVDKNNVDNVIDSNADGEYTISFRMTKHAPPPTNNPPESSGNITIEMDEDTYYKINLKEIFSDPDGDPLIFSSEHSENFTVNITSDGIAIITPKNDWYGYEKIKFIAKDTSNQYAYSYAIITVKDVGEPPEIRKYTPSENQLTIEHNKTLTFRIDVYDPDSPEVYFKWYVNDERQPENTNNFTYTFPYSNKLYYVIGEVSDGEYVKNVTWYIDVEPPNGITLSIVQPLNNSMYYEGEIITFYAILPGIDPNELPNLKFVWKDNGKEFAYWSMFNCTNLTPGEHVIEVEVINKSTGKIMMSREIVLLIKEREKEFADKTVILLVFGILILAIFFLFWVYTGKMKKKRMEKMKKEKEKVKRRKRRKQRKKRRK